MSTTGDYILVVHEGVDTLHCHPSFEECNVDDALIRSHISTRTAAEMLSSGTAKACLFCEPNPEAQTLDVQGPDDR